MLRDTRLTVIEQLGGKNLVIGGKSTGGRIASLVADGARVAELVCVGCPFHPVGKPEQLRGEHLRNLKTSTLIVQGEVTAYELSDAIQFHWLPDGDYSFQPREASGRTEQNNLAEALAEFRVVIPIPQETVKTVETAEKLNSRRSAIGQRVDGGPSSCKSNSLLPIGRGWCITYEHGECLAATQPMYLRRPQREVACFLYRKTAGSNVSGHRPAGTGFVLHAFGEGQRDFLYLVTAKHVIPRHVHEPLVADGTELFLRLNRGLRFDTMSPGEGVVYRRINDDSWIVHPDPSVDIAVARLEVPRGGPPANAPATLHTYPLELVTQTPHYLKTTDERHDTPWPPLEGEDVLFVGLTYQFPGAATNLPVVRKGSIALVTDEPLSGGYGPSKYHVIASQIYPGNSGAPVWVYLQRADDGSGTRSLFMLGVLAYGYAAIEELRPVRGQGNAFYNLGLALVTPIEKVLDIINSPDEIARRNDNGGQFMAGIPLSD